jgi:RNA polymerase primary sigma factor
MLVMRQLKITKQVTNREAPSLDKYLREIGKVKLLSPDEEVILVRKIREGDRKALETLINSNLRFVVSVAKQYQNQGLTLPDLINEGNLGLIKAAERFDETRGFKFISYAVWWIRQSILQSLAEQSRIVRLPLNKIGSINKINKAFTQLEQEYQREPMPEEIAEILDLHPSIVDESLNSNNYHVSMDAPLKDDEKAENNLYDVMTVNETPNPDVSLMDNSLKVEIERTLSTLNEREAEILRYYYGLNGLNAHTLEEIGKELDLTRERVRQVKEKALKKLQNIQRNKLLKSYLA